MTKWLKDWAVFFSIWQSGWRTGLFFQYITKWLQDWAVFSIHDKAIEDWDATGLDLTSGFLISTGELVQSGCNSPKGGRGCLMSPSCLESQGCHLIPLSYLLSCYFCLILLLFLSCHFSANGPVSWLFPQKTLKYFSLRIRLFCMALVEQLGDDSWSVVCAACCHMALVFAIITFFYFILHLSIPFYIFL